MDSANSETCLTGGEYAPEASSNAAEGLAHLCLGQRTLHPHLVLYTLSGAQHKALVSYWHSTAAPTSGHLFKEGSGSRDGAKLPGKT